MKKRNTSKNYEADGPMMVISLRVDLDTLEKLEIYAESINLKPTTVARDLIREGLERGGFELSRNTLLEMAENRPIMRQPAAAEANIVIVGTSKLFDEERVNIVKIFEREAV